MSHVVSFQDIFKKRNLLECPECRQKVTMDIDLLPPNILANRILESMTQTQSQTKILPPPPSLPLPCPRRNTSSAKLPSKPPAPAPSESVQTSLPKSPSAITSVNTHTSPIKLPVFSAPTCSVAPSPSTGQAAITGNPSTNPFIDLIDATPYYSKVRKESLPGAMTQLHLGGQNENLVSSTSHQSLIESLPVPAVPPPRPPATPSVPPDDCECGPPLPDRKKMKQWQLSPRALIAPPNSSSGPPLPAVYKAVYEYKASQLDELSLKRGELYHVTEKCHDGWFKGKHINTGNVGVFPGNHVREYDPKQAKKPKRKELVNVKEMNLIDLSDEEQKMAKDKEDSDSRPETDAERLQKLKKIRETLRAAHQQQQRQQSNKSAAATGEAKCKAEKYRYSSTRLSRLYC